MAAERSGSMLAEMGLPRGLARMVAAGRLSLVEARRRAARRRPDDDAGSPEAEGSPWLTSGKMMSAGVLMGMIAVLMMGRGTMVRPSAGTIKRPGFVAARRLVAAEAPPDSRPVSRVRPPAEQVDIQRDAKGRLTRIAGRSPAAVLRAYCEADIKAGGCDAEAIGPLAHRLTGFRLGLFRRTVQQGAIRIRREGRSSSWVTGNGVSPIPVEIKPDYPPGFILFPVK